VDADDTTNCTEEKELDERPAHEWELVRTDQEPVDHRVETIVLPPTNVTALPP
jgi:hypothetical protein